MKNPKTMDLITRMLTNKNPAQEQNCATLGVKRRHDITVTIPIGSSIGMRTYACTAHLIAPMGCFCLTY